MVTAMLTVAGSSARAQEADDVPPPELRRLLQAIRLIKAEYVIIVDDARLASGCRAGLRGPQEGPSPGHAPAIDLTAIPPMLKRAHASRSDVPYPRLVDDCLGGMVTALDARSEYWPPDEFRAMSRGPAGTASVGVELTRGDGAPEVVWVIEGGPAARGGVAVGERLVEIDGWPTAGATLTAVVQRLRGAPQSAVTLGLERDGARRTLTLQREPVKEQTLRLGVLEPGGQSPRVWHLAIRKFQEGTLRELDTAGSKALSDGRGPAGGIILDLRDNTGGLLSTMVSLASAFLREGLPVGQTEGRTPHAKQRFVTGPRQRGSYLETTLPEPLAATLKSSPLIVLVNDGPTSGAEMMAAALQSNGRGRVAGLPTAGVGTIQTILPLQNSSAIRLTTSVWTGPRGEPLEGRGVTPDVTITTARGSRPRARATAGEDAELAQALEVLRRAPR